MPNAPSRAFPAVVSLVAGIVILATKFVAYALTGSAAILADALESIVNVLAAGVAVLALRLSSQPVDANHPYGHGKVELLSAAFEGGLVFAASLGILWSGMHALLWPPGLRDLDRGLAISTAAAVANAALGLYLLRRGRTLGSQALAADGQHVLSDVYTTVGALLGLAAAWVTGIERLDGTTAVIAGLLLSWQGVLIFRRASDGLMDAEDPELVQRLNEAFGRAVVPGMHGLHHVRAIRSGEFIHIDAHVFVPADWSVAQAHAASHLLEAALKRESGIHGELALHLDPWEGPQASVQ